MKKIDESNYDGWSDFLYEALKSMPNELKRRCLLKGEFGRWEGVTIIKEEGDTDAVKKRGRA